MKVRFRSALMLALLGTLLLTGVLVATASYLNAQSSAKDLSERVLTQATERIDLRVRAELTVAEEQAKLNTLLANRHAVATDDMTVLALFFLDEMRAHPELSYLTLTYDANGNLCDAMRRPDGALRVRFLKRQPDGALELTDYDENQGKLTLVQRLANRQENEGRSRPYYVAARDAKHPIWTESYLFFGESTVLEIPGITYAAPISNPDGSLLGVLTADFDLRSISRFLASLDVFEHGIAFVVENRRDGSRRVVAHPQPEILTREIKASDGSPTREPIPAAELSDARVTALLSALPKGTLDPESPVQFSRFTLSGTPYVASFRALRNGNLQWIVCVVTPEDDILGAVHRSAKTTAIIVSAGIAVAIGIAIFLASAVSRSMRALAVESEAIGRLELDTTVHVDTSILEIERLGTAMEEMKRGLRSFRKYVSADLVRELLASGQEAVVGGRRMRLSIHFSDIAGFTSIAEEMPPEKLVEILGEYLEEMTKPILQSGGTVDKYIGDAVMAFWGAPRADEDHALHACEAALVNRDRLDTLNDEWEKQGRPRLEARAALHTGDVIVGNVGSGARLDYTVIGDAVNLASRLEGLNKRYGTKLMISETTYALVKDVMVTRPLDRVSVKGKAKSVDVYELFGKRGDVSEKQMQAAKVCTEAFALYLEKKWESAAAQLREHLRENPDDEAARVIAERCERLMANPPAGDWDGTEKITTK